MRFYLIHKDEIISESGDAGFGYEFNKDEIERNHPGEIVMEIDEKDYSKIKENHEYFKIKNKKLTDKTAMEKLKTDDNKEKWKETHTIEGLNKRIEELKNNK